MIKISQLRGPKIGSQSIEVVGRKGRSNESTVSPNAFHLSGGKSEVGVGKLDLGRSASLRVQAHQKNEASALKRLTMMLPRDQFHVPRPELLQDLAARESLEGVTKKLMLEGIDGPARLAFEQEVEELYERYGQDLGLEDSVLRETLNSLLRKIEDEISESAIKPWSPDDLSRVENMVPLPERLNEISTRHRQMVMEGSGDFSRVLSELTILAQNGDEKAVMRLGDFVMRLSDSLDAGSTSLMKTEAKKELSSGLIQPMRDGALDRGQAFLAQLRSEAA